MNQVSQISFGTDITRVSGYLQYGNERLGNVDLVIENTSDYDLVFQAKTQSAVTASGFANVGNAVTVVARGQKTVSYNIVGKKFGFFGSGQDSSGNAKSITANVSVVIRNKGDLRGAQVDIVNVGHRGWGFDKAFNPAATAKNWGAPPDFPNSTGITPPSNGYGGVAGGGGV